MFMLLERDEDEFIHLYLYLNTPCTCSLTIEPVIVRATIIVKFEHKTFAHFDIMVNHLM